MIYFIYSLGLSGWNLIAFIVAYLCAIVFSITAHEFSHAFIAYKCGDSTPKTSKRLSINPANHIDPIGALSFLIVGFGWAKPVMINSLNFRNYNKGRRLVSLAGITANLILAIIFSGFYYFFTDILMASGNIFLMFLGYLFMLMMIINLALFVFNLIPIYPLDGFNFIATFMKPDNKFIQFMERYGTWIMLIFLISPLFDLIYGNVISWIKYGLFSFWGLF